MKKYVIPVLCFFLMPFISSKLFANESACEWMDEAIEKDFAPFSSGITLEMIDKVASQWYRYGRFKIINNQVFGPPSATYNLLGFLCTKYEIPDVEFIFLLEDGFIHEPTNGQRNPSTALDGPVFGSTKCDEFTHVLHFADWKFDPSKSQPQYASQSYDWAYSSILVEEYSQSIPWSEKKPMAMWRGGLQGGYDYSPKNFFNTPRGMACLLSSQRPDIIDAGTNWGGDHPVVAKLITPDFEPRRNFEPIAHQMAYKYQINIDGHTSTYPGLQWRLLSNCTVLKQETENKMWYFYALKPWVHYVPLKEDLSDLVEKVEWCINNDDLAYQIAMEGRKFAQENLLPEHCLLYCYKALKKYAELQRFTPQLEKGQRRRFIKGR